MFYWVNLCNRNIIIILAYISSVDCCNNLSHFQLRLQTLPSTSFRSCAHSYFHWQLVNFTSTASTLHVYISSTAFPQSSTTFNLWSAVAPFCSIAATSLLDRCSWSFQQLLSLPSTAALIFVHDLSYTSYLFHRQQIGIPHFEACIEGNHNQALILNCLGNISNNKLLIHEVACKSNRSFMSI